MSSVAVTIVVVGCVFMSTLLGIAAAHVFFEASLRIVLRLLEHKIVRAKRKNKMKWLNAFNLPGPLVDLITEDVYSEKREEMLGKFLSEIKHDGLVQFQHLSVNELIKPPRVRALSKRHYKNIVKDVASDIFRLLGQAMHSMFKMSADRANAKKQQAYIAEERLFARFTINGIEAIVSGEPDLVTPDGELHDYKVTQVYAWQKGAKLEWEQQLNTYAYLRHLKGLKTERLKIVFIIRDWSLRETVQEGYPPAQAMTQEIPMWSLDEQEAFVLNRLRIHLKAEALPDDELPECSPEEMWEKPEAWAVIRDGSSRAAKLFRAEELGSQSAYDSAIQDEAQRNSKLKVGDKPYAVEHRPGERTRCEFYCDVRSFCSQYKEYMSAAVRKKKSTEVNH